MAAIEVEQVTAERWEDVVSLFTRKGRRGGKPQTDGCWCRFWDVRGKSWWEDHGAGHRRAQRDAIRTGATTGLLAYVDGEPVGWCRLGPRESFDRLEHSAKLARVDDEDVWSIVCFYVHPGAKRQGVASALLDAAVDHVRAQGMQIVEAYPVRAGHMNIDAYTGYLPMFLDAGFDEVRDAGRRTIVRLELAKYRLLQGAHEALDPLQGGERSQPFEPAEASSKAVHHVPPLFEARKHSVTYGSRTPSGRATSS